MTAELLQKVWPEWSLENRIGTGAYGTVYKVSRKDYGVESYGAIKMVSIPASDGEVDSLRSEGLDEQATIDHFETIVKDFVGEIRMMVSLEGSPNIVNVKDYRVVKKEDRFGWDILILMELLTPLSEYTNGRTMTEQEVIKLGCDICTALETCHRGKILHRDVKPGNIMVHDISGTFKLGDFGIARKLENMSSGLSQRYTPKYMAPEVATSPYYDARVDIYSLGVVLYQLLNQMRIPFQESQRIQSMHDIENAIKRRTGGEALPKPSEASEAMAAVILKACAFDPDRRFATVGEMKAALMRVANGDYRPVPVAEPDKTISVRKAEEPDKTVAVRRAPKREAYDPEEEDYDDYEEAQYVSRSTEWAIVAVLLAIAVVLAAIWGIPKLLDGSENDQQTQDQQPTTTVTDGPAGDRFLNESSTIAKTEPITTPTNPVRIACTDLEVSDVDIYREDLNGVWQLTVTPVPADTTDEITFLSTDTSVVQVSDSGRVSAVDFGRASVLVICGSVTKQIPVTFFLTEEDDDEEFVLTLKSKDCTLTDVGATYNLYDGDVDASDIVWSTDHAKVVTIKNGIVTAVGNGRTRVYGEYGDQKVSCWVSVRLPIEDAPEAMEPEYPTYTEPEETIATQPEYPTYTEPEETISAEPEYPTYTEPEETIATQPEYPEETHTYGIRINGKTPNYGTEQEAETTLKVGDAISVKVVDENGTRVDTQWVASKSGVVFVSGSTISGEGTGVVTLATTINDQRLTLKVTVKS